MLEIVVFLGPSLSREEAKEIIDAKYMPPARRGDIFNAVKGGAKIIGLIDGVFFQDSAVSHREILYGLERAVKIIGSSSMGALRASELYLYGMEGIGKIYELYKGGRLVSDDEVALIFDPITFEPLSEPLINIRYDLEMAEGRGDITEEVKKKILSVARSLYFPDRNYERILDIVGGTIEKECMERFKTFIKEDRKDLKREDAIEALKRIREISESSDQEMRYDE